MDLLNKLKNKVQQCSACKKLILLSKISHELKEEWKDDIAEKIDSEWECVWLYLYLKKETETKIDVACCTVTEGQFIKEVGQL